MRIIDYLLNPLKTCHQQVAQKHNTARHLNHSKKSNIALSLFAVMLLVDQGLYIGTVADLNDSQALTDAAVTHVLSVDSVDPTPLLPPSAKICNKWINVLDVETSDLLSYMDICFLFLREAVDMGGAALVHW